MGEDGDLLRRLAGRAAQWEADGLGRTMAAFGTAQLPEATVDGERRVLLSSSNYLGLSTHPEVLAAAHAALDRYGVGSGGSRLTTGTSELHLELERELAQWLGYTDCVFFPTGFQANLAAVSVVADASTVIFSDAKNHASLIDGCRAAKGRTVVYPHRDLAALDALLAEHAGAESRLVVTDGLFSMDGTVPDIPALVELCRARRALLLVDDAHGIGTLGDGRGCAAPGPDILVGTASKALGAEGGFVCTNRTIAGLLRNQGRSFVFSTAPSPAIVAATLAAVRLLRRDAEPVRRLQRNVRTFTSTLGELGVRTGEAPQGSPAPIIPIPVGDERRAMDVMRQLHRESKASDVPELPPLLPPLHRADSTRGNPPCHLPGVHLPAIRYPTVARGEAILRATVMATHSAEQLRYAAHRIAHALASTSTR